MDQIILHHSHQQALSHVLNDHSTFYGLDIKVLPKNLFPGGKSFHHDKPYMLQWMKEELEEVRAMSEANRRRLLIANSVSCCFSSLIAGAGNVPHVLDF